MTEKRFTDDGIEEIENQSFTDNLTDKTYWFDNGLDELLELLNNLHEENKRMTDKLNSLALELLNYEMIWKQQYKENMRAFQICVSEIARASNNGYVVSDEFQKYYADLRKKNKEIKKKIERLGL